MCIRDRYMGIGSLKISLPDIFRALAGEGEKKYQTAIMNIRLPRVLAAIFVGATLAASGAVMQCVLRNPLASASTLGVSQGAAFGAALGIIVFGGGVITNSNSTSTVSVDNPYIVTLCAFVFGSISSVVVILISRLKKNVGPGGLILAGTALSAMFAGGSTLLQYFADDTSLGAVVFWTFGNLGSASWKDLRFISVVFVLSFIYYMYNRWNYNAMEAGYDTASVEKMSSLTRGWCFTANFVEWAQPMRDEFYRRMGLEVSGFGAGMHDSAEVLLQAVRSAGYDPIVKYVPYDWSDDRSPDEAAEYLIKRCGSDIGDAALMARARKIAAELVDENGVFVDSVSTCVAWIYWNTEA